MRFHRNTSALLEYIRGTCENITVDPDDERLYCPAKWDTLLCWPPTLAGTTANQSCPTNYLGYDKRRLAFRECWPNGSWYIHPESQKDWSNYTTCIDHEDLEMDYPEEPEPVPTVTLKSGYGTDNSTEEDREEVISGDCFQTLGWKVVLLLQFQSQFEIVVMIGTYIAYMCSLIDVAFAYSTEIEQITRTYSPIGMSVIYFFDVIYTIDILLMIMYKHTKWVEVSHLYEERHAISVIVDIISVTPLDAIYYSLITYPNMNVIYTLRLRYALRIFRFMARIKRLKNLVGINHLHVEILDFIISFSLLLVTVSCLHYVLVCSSSCKYKDVAIIIEAFCTMTAKITGRGYPVEYENNLYMYFLHTSTNFFSFLYITGYVAGLFVMAVIQQIKVKFVYANMQELIRKKMRAAKIKDEVLYATYRRFFTLFWDNRKGVNIDNFNIPVIPEITAREISLDISWDALKHSHLFRDKEVHFLRFVAPYMKQKFMIPGETIYRRNHFKSSMVYVVSGVIEILSEEDGETPILYFSGGTCIGESSLLFDYPSTCSVVCHSYCEVYVLYRKDFLAIIKKYPEEYRLMSKDIKDRYEDTLKYQQLLQLKYKEKKQKRELIKMKWLKTTLHDLLSKDRDVADKPKRTLTISERRTIREFDRLVFCCNYLDMLVITEQLALVGDSVFLRTTFPCILQPNSFIVVTWNNIVVLAAFILAVIYPFYAAFEPRTSKFYLGYLYFVTFLWFCDIYMILSTGIKTKDELIAKCSNIAIYRIQTVPFILDLVAAFPIELFALFVAGPSSSQTFVLLQIPRLLKLHRLQWFFNESLAAVDDLPRTYLKYTVYMLLLTYYISALLYLHLCYEFVCDTDNNVFVDFINNVAQGNTVNTIILCTYFAAQQLTSFGLKISGKGVLNSLYVPMIFIELITTLFYVNFLAHAIAIEALKTYDRLKMRDYTTNVITVMHNLNVNSALCNHTLLYLHSQLDNDAATNILYPPSYRRQYVHPTLTRETRRLSYIALMQQIPLFEGLPYDLVADICANFFTKVFVPGKPITYAGEVCKEMHIIIEGFCEMFTSSGEKLRVIGPGDSLSVIELCSGIPVVNNVVALTHCKVCSIKMKHFMHTYQLYPELLVQIKTTAKAVLESLRFEDLAYKQFINIGFNYNSESNAQQQPSFKYFGYGLDVETKKGADYYSYFNEIPYLAFMRFVLMRQTIRAHGRFIRYWEVSRCTFAFLTAILTPVPFLPACVGCQWNYILLFLDITAWMDIYLRHHVCYFDEKGVEITHPLKTAIHYWSHGFFIDLLGVLPFDVILGPLVKSNVSVRYKVVCQLIRILQCHRILGGIRYIDQNSILLSRAWNLAKFIPIVILIINTLGAVIVNFRCHFSPTIQASKEFTAGVICDQDSWIVQSEVTKPLSPVRTHMYGLFIITMAVTGPGLGGFSIQTSFEARNMTMITLLGYWIFTCISAKVISVNLFKNIDLKSYQEAMASLVTFLDYKRIDVKLKREVIQHFEYVWHKTQGKNLHTILHHFNYALQEDILLDVYGTALKQSAVFSQANDSFFRSLLLNVKHEMIMKRGIISQVNDVNPKIYFLLKGKVEVLGPDYNRMLILPVGSLFGNIDDVPMSRQSLTMVAKGHVELLIIQTSAFYQILSKYNYLHQEFRKLFVFNTDYVLGAPLSPMNAESLELNNRPTLTHSFKSVIYSENYDFVLTLKLFFTHFLWDVVILGLVCYTGFVLELYQLTVHDGSPILISVLYVLDFLFIVNIYVNFRTSYEDEFGVLITNKRQIAMRYIKDPLGFRLHLVSVIPLEAIAIIFANKHTAWRIWSYCRCNRFIRIVLLINYWGRKTQQLNINVNFMRTASLLMWISLLLQILTSFLITITCIDPANSVRPIMDCNWTKMTARERFDTYSYQFSVILYVFTKTSIYDYFPNSAFLSFLIICILIGSRFVVIHFMSDIAATLDMVLNSRMLYEERIDKIKEHMVRERISTALLERIWRYVRVLWKQKGGLQFPLLLFDAPYYLREAVLNAMFGCHLRKHYMFRHCHVDMLRQIAAQMRTRTFFPGDNITFVNDIDECMYFIHEGAVDVLSEDNLDEEKIERVLYGGEMFGFTQGIDPSIGHDYTYRASRLTIILMLERKTWIHLLNFFPASKAVLLNHSLNPRLSKRAERL